MFAQLKRNKIARTASHCSQVLRPEVSRKQVQELIWICLEIQVTN